MKYIKFALVWDNNPLVTAYAHAIGVAPTSAW